MAILLHAILLILVSVALHVYPEIASLIMRHVTANTTQGKYNTCKKRK
jgi:hypothetical protein